MNAIRSEARRNKGFEETHQELIETAVRLISEKGTDALSIAALSRAMGINRTTVYYHFDSREALLAAVKQSAKDQLARGMDIGASAPERISLINRFVLDNPELIKLWIDDFVSGKNIRDSYPPWDELVEGIRDRFTSEHPGVEFDAEVYCVMLLAGAIIGPRVFANSVQPEASIQSIAERFLREEQRTVERDQLLP